MYVRMLREWRGIKRGRILDIPDGQANMMVRRGLAESSIGVGGSLTVDSPTEDHRVETAPMKRKRGRPRKNAAS